VLSGFFIRRPIFAFVISAMMGTFLDYFTGIMHDLMPLS